MKTPEPIKRFADLFAELPGVGPRQALRIALYVVHKGNGFASGLVSALSGLRSIKICERCFNLYEGGNLCEICSDASREQDVIAVIEKETDLLSMEKTGRFRGRYLVIGDMRKLGVLSSEQKIKLRSLEEQIKDLFGGKAKEIILALNPNPVGDVISSLISEEMRPYALKITRLGRGIPTGGEIEFADEETLGEAITRRG
ncbi:MAG: toprim domain-containing protein [Patescibacteria group bacterium]|nr:toprim domain-containing protein [Patescibacteria group bacterium]